MKVLVTGVKGQLGGDVVACLEAQNVPCWGVDIDDFDLTDEKAVRQAVLGYAPDVIVHCAAYTAVDKAEDEGREVCRKVNVEGTRNMAQCAKELDAKFMYFSTDYVFPGTAPATSTALPSWKGNTHRKNCSPSTSPCGSAGCLPTTATTLSAPCCG